MPAAAPPAAAAAVALRPGSSTAAAAVSPSSQAAGLTGQGRPPGAYSGSPNKGCPAAAMWMRIWCGRPAASERDAPIAAHQHSTECVAEGAGGARCPLAALVAASLLPSLSSVASTSPCAKISPTCKDLHIHKGGARRFIPVQHCVVAAGWLGAGCVRGAGGKQPAPHVWVGHAANGRLHHALR